jgi:hypothetical protein
MQTPNEKIKSPCLECNHIDKDKIRYPECIKCKKSGKVFLWSINRISTGTNMPCKACKNFFSPEQFNAALGICAGCETDYKENEVVQCPECLENVPVSEYDPIECVCHSCYDNAMEREDSETYNSMQGWI